MKLKFILLIVFFLALPSKISAQNIKFGEAKGLFLSLGIGPRIPVGEFAKSHNLGIGFDVGVSYTDNFYIPVFFYGKIGYQHYPGLQNYYKISELSSISTNIICFDAGVRFYLPPIVKNIVVVMPIIEAGASYYFSSTFNQFKLSAGKLNFADDSSKFGFHIAGGVSVFLLDVMVHYTYLQKSQNMAVDMRLRIPLYLKM